MSGPRAIVAATDFSESAQLAVKQAAQLAKQWNATLTLIHVFNDSAWSSIKKIHDLSSWSTSSPVESARQRLAAICNQLTHDFGVTVDAQVLVGCASKEIHKFVMSHQAGLLVVGEHGENWIRDAVLGGTALKVLEAARIPVLLVRRMQSAPYRDILIATDCGPASERAACLALACFPEAKLALIYAWLVPFEASMRMGGAQDEDIERYRASEFQTAAAALDALVRRCDEKMPTTRMAQLALHGSPAAVVFAQARARGSDLIVVGKHGGHELDERLLGSVTQNILYYAECDVLLSV